MRRLLVGALAVVRAGGCGGTAPVERKTESPRLVVATPAVPAAAAPSPADVSDPGEVLPEPSTFHSLGVRWPVRGDANRGKGAKVDSRPGGSPAISTKSEVS